MADDLEKNKQQGGQGQKSGQTGGQQQQGNVDPNKKNPSQNEQDEKDRQRRAS
jgi:hypothetical protein